MKYLDFQPPDPELLTHCGPSGPADCAARMLGRPAGLPEDDREEVQNPSISNISRYFHVFGRSFVVLLFCYRKSPRQNRSRQGLPRRPTAASQIGTQHCHFSCTPFLPFSNGSEALMYSVLRALCSAEQCGCIKALFGVHALASEIYIYM